jgi:hypothetical protein
MQSLAALILHHDKGGVGRVVEVRRQELYASQSETQVFPHQCVIEKKLEAAGMPTAN